MSVALFHALAGFVLLYAGGEALVRGSTQLALHMGVSRMAVGLTVVAFGTSSPELAVTLDAALVGESNIAVGNVVGSNICNLALVLGLAAIVRPIAIRGSLVRLHTPIMIGSSLLLIALLANGRLGRLEGVLLFAGIMAYILFGLRAARREAGSAPPVPSGTARSGRGMLLDLLLIAGGLASLAFGAQLFVAGAVELAEVAGVSTALIGLTAVALGTSLPELATALLASVRAQGDIAVGAVVGSNIFNILAILGITAIVHPLIQGGVTWGDLGVMLLIAVLTLALLRSGLRLSRIEGVVLVTCYLAYVSWRLVA